LGSFTEHPHNGVMLKGNLYLDQIYTTTYLTNTDVLVKKSKKKKAWRQ
jgi:hypothetical protein